MFRNESNCIYNQEHLIEVTNRDCNQEQRRILIVIHEFANYVLLKIRDTNKFCFNYTSKIDFNTFEAMKNQQCLDINFNEFKSQMLEMLHQNLRHEMYIKCETEDIKCKMIFYGKSRIKNLIFLILELTMTDQNEIFEEMNSNIMNLQGTNRMLNNQLQAAKMRQTEFEENIRGLSAYNKRLSSELYKQIQKIEKLLPYLMSNLTDQINKKIQVLERKLIRLRQDLTIVKENADSKSKSNMLMSEEIQKLKLELRDKSISKEKLEDENIRLQSFRQENEHIVLDLRQTLSDRERTMCDLKKEMEILKKDLQDAAMIIAQRTSSNDELARDLVQANQMLVNFNNHYDMKVKEVDQLQSIVISKDKFIKDLNTKCNELVTEYEEYKTKHNAIKEQKMNHQLHEANRRIEELEKQNREASKLNGLLTKKLSVGSMINFDKMC